MTRPDIHRVFDLRRLIAGAAVVALILLPLYFLVLRDRDSGVAPASLLETPPLAGQSLDVGLQEGELAPDFEISMPDGERVRLSDLRGQPVLINFWATWCTSCLSEMPEIKQLQSELGVDSFAVLAVNAGESRADAIEFIDFLDAPFLYGLDSGLVVTDAYGVWGLPQSVFIDSAGVVSSVYIGHVERPRLDELVAAAIEARPPVEQPAVLRPVTTIIRDRFLLVSEHGPGDLTITSRSLRCDASYCARTSVDLFAATDGIMSADLQLPPDGQPALRVMYDSSLLDAQQVAERLVEALEQLDDPVYKLPLEVRFVQPS